MSKPLAVFALIASLALAGCNKAKEADVNPTSSPEETPVVRALADFQLVGNIEHAFAGEIPPIEIPSGNASLPSDTSSPEPSGTPVGQTTETGGIMRITLEDANSEVRDACGLTNGSSVLVFWTTDTRFDLTDSSDIENRIEGRTAGVTGKAYRDPSASDTTPGALSTPAGSPSSTTTPGVTVGEGPCVFVANLVGFTGTGLPTPEPTARRRSTPKPTSTPTSTPTASPSPSPSKSPKPSPTASSSPSATI